MKSTKRVVLITGASAGIDKRPLKILKSRNPRTRYAAPFHARLFLLLCWLMSDRVFDRVMAKQLAKLANQGT